MEDKDFDKLYELVSINYKNKKEKCLVCHCSIDSEEIKLSCTHQYHYNCFDIKKDKKCFYCGKINKDNKKINKDINILNIGNCKSIIKTGPNKGESCNRINCKYHNKNII